MNATPTFPAPSPRKKKFLWLKIGQWILLPLLALAAWELVVRKYSTFTGSWYEEAAQQVANHHVDYLFVGSSRVAAAIDASTFSDIMSRRLGRTTRAINLGQGYSTPIEHYLGLRHLFEIAPKNLAGCVIFWEAPGQTFHLGAWGDDWFWHEQPELILPVLRRWDLPALWFSRGAIDPKLTLTIETLLRPSNLFARRRHLHKRIMDRGELLVSRFLPQNKPTAPVPIADLPTQGGIRVEEESVQRARKLAIILTDESLRQQRLNLNWQSPIYENLRALVEQHHGKIILYDMPMSLTFGRVYQTNIGRANQRNFLQQLSHLRTTILHPPFSYSDQDFPDLWHLRQSRCHEFTSALAQSYLQHYLQQSSTNTAPSP